MAQTKQKKHHESFLGAGVAAYENDVAQVPHEKFGPVTPTTFGLNGAMSGVQFIESELITRIGVDVPLEFPCVRVVCNYGDIKSERFEQMVAAGQISLASEIHAARAREKRRAASKPRKMQGSGRCFNSSVVVWIYSEMHSKVYKIRLFRNGIFGLPGTKPHMIRDIIAMCEGPLAGMLSAINGNVSKLVELAPIMRNYKWIRYLAPEQILNLRMISRRIVADDVSGETPLKVDFASFICGDASMSMQFSKKSETGERVECAYVNIFLRGKINILGAHSVADTEKIRDYIMRILSDETYVIVPTL